MAYVHRLDHSNVGDMFCTPHLYLNPFPGDVYDIFDNNLDLNKEKIIIVGGGGLGRKFFAKGLKKLADPQRTYKLVAWGVGADTVVDKSGAALDPAGKYDLYSNFFEGFDEVGIRSWSKDQRYRWVPCVSAMHPLLDKYRDHKPTNLVGYYQHKHTPFESRHGNLMSNNGSNLEAKLAFLADHEYIVSNTYHGVYWATLLNRKVLCLPFKSGLFSFKHKPLYISTLTPSEEEMHNAASFPDSLEECRKANTDYCNYLLEKYSSLAPSAPVAEPSLSAV